MTDIPVSGTKTADLPRLVSGDYAAINPTARANTTVAEVSAPVAVGLAGVHLSADGPSVRMLPLFGCLLVAYDVDTFTAEQAAHVVRIVVDRDIEVISAMAVAR